MSIATATRGTLLPVTSSDAPPTSRRALRAQAAERARVSAASPEVDADESQAAHTDAPAAAAPVSAPVAATPAAAAPAVAAPVSAPVSAARTDDAASLFASTYASESSAGADAVAGGRVALGWVDADALVGRRAPSDLAAASSTYVPVLPDLLPSRRRPRRSPRRALVSLAVVLAVAGGYTAATLLWPLDNVAPAVSASDGPTVSAPDAEVSWPVDGIGAVGVEGMGRTLASSDASDTIASITKLVSVLMVLDREPLEPGEQGEEREVVYADRVDYWNFLGRGESALDVPVGGTLTQYQLMQGALIASAGNYTEMLTRELWPTDESFASAAAEWLGEHKLDGISLVEPTGIDRGNTADAASLIRLASIAMADPVVAEIVATESAEIPGVGTIENTNPLLGDNGVVGIKTGGLIGSYNLLAARDVQVGDTLLRVYAVALDQPTAELRGTATAALLDQVEAQVATPTTLAAGATVGTVTTPWGTEAEIVTTDDAAVILWNGESVAASADVALGASREAGDGAGELRIEGPVDSATSGLALSSDLGEPDAWWRLTHPLHLLGIVR